MRTPWLVLPVLAGGCTIIYNGDDVRPKPDAAEVFDAPIVYDAAPIVDVNPAALMLMAPAEPVLEGSGTGGSRPALVEVFGSNIEPNAEITAVFVDPAPTADGTLKIIETAVPAQHDRILIALQVPVLTSVGDGSTAKIRITATQPGATVPVEVEVAGLDELAPATATLDSGSLKRLYSRVRINGALHLTGTKPALIRAVGDIVIAANVDADASARVAGPGGCNGGMTKEAGGCGNGGGKSGGGTLDLTAGGGGGSFGGLGAQGTSGAGTGGAPGGTTGDDFLSILEYSGAVEGNRGNGGGTGVGVGGGSGGGGGGTIELTAGGTLVVQDGKIVRSAGGAGAGSGGGGSGGAILLRSAVSVTAPAASISAKGDGMGAGAGGLGRIRIDTPVNSVLDMSDVPAAVRGPSWMPGAALIVRTEQVQVTALGTRDGQHRLQVNGDSRGDVQLDATGKRAVSVRLRAGVNTLCLIANGAAAQIRDENKNCISVGYAPAQ